MGIEYSICKELDSIKLGTYLWIKAYNSEKTILDELICWLYEHKFCRGNCLKMAVKYVKSWKDSVVLCDELKNTNEAEVFKYRAINETE